MNSFTLRRARGITIIALSVLSTACAPAMRERVPAVSAPPASREIYERELRRSGRAGDLLARAWRDAGDAAARSALRVPMPFREGVIFSDDTPSALAYRLTMRQGEPFHVRVDPPATRRGGVFLELFEIHDDRLRLVARSAPGDHSIRMLIQRPGDYVLLVQPQLERGGRYRIALGDVGEAAYTVTAAPVEVTGTAAAMVFPVEGRSMPSIGSGFGDPRDGGVRAHHGVDIFAPRGTPVLAAVDGRIINVGNTPLGGLVIWQQADASGHEFYYAHLSAQHVRVGQQVRAGEVIGAVGNTGNARTTPPHLHFGVYSPGRQPVDPAPLLASGRIVTDRVVATYSPPPAIHVSADIGVLGMLARSRSDATWVRSYPSADGFAFTALRTGAQVQLLGASEAWYRVLLDDGSSGFVSATQLEPLNER
jgi:peptidoglycan LD-endopeptidase LytH